MRDMNPNPSQPGFLARLAELLCACALICIAGRLLKGGQWLSPAWMPVVLVGAVLVPTRIRGQSLASLGLRWGHLRYGISLAVAAGVAGLLLVAGLLQLFRMADLTWPMAQAWPREQAALWGLYQFTHVALPEELFFRGYLQGDLLALLKSRIPHRGNLAAALAIGIGAGLFAICHAVIWGNPGTLLTFFPGLVMGWLYWKSDSLLAPILFHGCANIGYAWLGGLGL